MSDIVSAEDNIEVIDNVDWSSAGFEDVVIRINKDSYSPNARSSDSNEPCIEIDYILSSTGERIHFERIGDIGYHYVDDVLITTVIFGEGNPNTRVIQVDKEIKAIDLKPRDGFSNFYYSGYYTWEIQAAEDYFRGSADDYVISLILNAIITVLLPGGLITVTVRTGVNAALNIFNFLKGLNDASQFFGDLGQIYGVDVIYGSYHGQCDILAWYGTKAFVMTKDKVIAKTSNNQFDQNPNHTWNGNPNDFTQPAACRVLDDTFRAY
jgi:hypothetical protein